MSNTLIFTQTKLTALGKTGKITPNADGYYPLLIGALNSSNNTGAHYYTATQAVIACFGPGSSFYRKIANGTVYAEVKHPVPLPGESDRAFQQRFLDIDPRNRVAHIRKVWLDMEFGKKNPHLNNPAMIGIFGEVKPVEPHGAILQSALDNPSENVCFSIRSVAMQNMVRGRLTREIEEVVTFDLVNEGGIVVASKWDSPATENVDIWTPQMDKIVPVNVDALKDLCKANATGPFAMESADMARRLLARYEAQQSPRIYSNW